MTSLPTSPEHPATQHHPLVCPECSRENDNRETFCAECGAALHSAEAEGSLAPLPPQTVLAGAYAVVERVASGPRENRYRGRRLEGRGGQGEELTVRERATDQEPFFSLGDERLAELAHPGLTRSVARFEQDGRAYSVEEAVVGVPLATRVGRTSEREAVAWGVQLCQLLGFLHRKGLLCPAVSPGALAIDREGRLRLADLGAIREKGSPAGAARIEDGYTAPEAYTDEAMDERADVFSVGAALYTLLTGARLPVEGWISAFEPPVFYPEKIVSADLERVLRRVLSPEPKDRHQSVDALKAELLTLGRALRFRSGWCTDRGLARGHNEDSVLVLERVQHTVSGALVRGLYMVSDGMGGAQSGEIASAIAVNLLARELEAAWSEGDPAVAEKRFEPVLRAAVEAANGEIFRYGREHPESAGLGATVVAAAVSGAEMALAWVGDSRAYLWEGGQLSLLTRDHSLVARLVELGQIGEDEARTHEHRHVLTRSLGTRETVTVDTVDRPLRPGARLLLCSDGLTTHVEDHALADILSRHRDPQSAARELVAAANAGGGSDNTAVVVVFVE